MPFLGKSDDNTNKEDVKMQLKERRNGSQTIRFRDNNGKNIEIDTFPIILHNGILDGKKWKQTKVIRTNDDYEILTCGEDGKYYGIIGDTIKSISRADYQEKINQAKKEGALLDDPEAIFARVYP